MDRKLSTQMLAEMKLFASFSAAEQRFIRRSLDVGLNRTDAVACWARGADETSRIHAQSRRYRMLDPIRACLVDDHGRILADTRRTPGMMVLDFPERGELFRGKRGVITTMLAPLA